MHRTGHHVLLADLVHPAAAIGHQPDVQHSDVGPQRRDAGQRGLGGARLPHHRDIRLGLQQVADPFADDLVIIQQEHADLPSRSHASEPRRGRPR
jgi:hypothetical protein